MNPADPERARREFFQSDPRGSMAVYLFGSFARGAARPDSDSDSDSDVDIGILSEQDSPETYEGLPLDLEGDLERLLGCRVQVVDLHRAPADLVRRVLRDGQLLLDRDRSRQIRFEVRRRNEYFELLPILREYRRWPANPQ
jgi:predicted nucleotidyltransferase